MADPSSAKKLFIPSYRSATAETTAGTTAGTTARKTAGIRKKGGDRASNQQKKDGGKSQSLDAGFQIEKTPPKIIPLKDCSKSEAYQLLSQRWADAMHLYNDPTVDLSERPIMYYGGSVWGKLPHQILASANKTLPPPSDYTPEGRRRGLLTPRPR